MDFDALFVPTTIKVLDATTPSCLVLTHLVLQNTYHNLYKGAVVVVKWSECSPSTLATEFETRWSLQFFWKERK